MIADFLTDDEHLAQELRSATSVKQAEAGPTAVIRKIELSGLERTGRYISLKSVFVLALR